MSITAIDADQLLMLLGRRADDPDVEAALTALNTLRRPELDPTDPDSFHAWVLVRRAGVEFGFVDEAYFKAAPRWRRRRDDVPLLLFQLYFYRGEDDITTFAGKLPHGLDFADSRDQARRKLVQFEPSRRSYIKDTWDLPGYRITLDYVDEGAAIDSIVCQLRIQPWPEAGRIQPNLRVDDWLNLFGLPGDSPRLRKSLEPLDLAAAIAASDDEREIELTDECGIELYFTEFRQLKRIASEAKLLPPPSPDDVVFAAVQFLRPREMDARGWSGALPYGLKFNDSQEVMVQKVGRPPDEQEDDRFSGVARWHDERFSIDVIYHNVENHLQRVTLMAPGFWRG